MPAAATGSAPAVSAPGATPDLDAGMDEGWMRAVAREMNLAETAFVVPHGDAYRLRWLTPAVEVALCGHATLGTAHVLWETGALPSDAVARFHTRSGLLTARKLPDGWIELDFPARAVLACEAPYGLTRALGATPLFVGKNALDYLVEVASAEIVRGLVPDLMALAKLPVRGVMVTAPADDPRFDCVSRFFAPAGGVPEDPVTGSAHCALGPFWGARLGKTELVAYQASARGGVLRVGLRGDRVLLRGQAVTISRGEILGPA